MFFVNVQRTFQGHRMIPAALNQPSLKRWMPPCVVLLVFQRQMMILEVLVYSVKGTSEAETDVWLDKEVSYEDKGEINIEVVGWV